MDICTETHPMHRHKDDFEVHKNVHAMTLHASVLVLVYAYSQQCLEYVLCCCLLPIHSYIFLTQRLQTNSFWQGRLDYLRIGKF